MRLRSALAALLLTAPVVVGVASEQPAAAAAPAALYVYSPAASTVRLRVSMGGDCDAAPNRELAFNGQIRARETLRMPLTWWCVCVSSTSVAHPENDWSPWQQYCGAPRTSRRDPLMSTFSIRLDGR
jgi:hypothetical protein